MGMPIGGINVFGGGLALYNAKGVLIGGLGASGDSSCANHNITRRTRHDLEHVHAWRVPADSSSRIGRQLGYRDRSIQTQNNRTIDGEVRGAKFSPCREASDQTVLHKGEELKFFTNLPAKAFVDCILRPCK
jgi:hypothetical protein